MALPASPVALRPIQIVEGRSRVVSRRVLAASSIIDQNRAGDNEKKGGIGGRFRVGDFGRRRRGEGKCRVLSVESGSVRRPVV
jgi:hypothetical protein